MKHIPDEAVQAALEYYSEGGCMGLDSYDRKEVATAMIEAALPHLHPVDVAAVRKQALEEAATLIDEGFDKPVGKAWRNDGKASKNDKCPHDQYMYEDCENCASAAIRTLSAEPDRCQRCQGNGEIITNWDRYLRSHKDDNGDEAVSECPDCDGKGTTAPTTEAEV